MRIVKLQPAVKNDFEYTIQHGNESGLFELIRKHGVWALHFRHRLKAPGVFHLEIKGRSSNAEVDGKWEKPLILRLKIVVES